ncbi:MAG: hypothetical protein ACFFFT_15135 [Candidatus Thorarchaeota archaeon]
MKKSKLAKFFLLLITFSIIFSHFLVIGYSAVVGIPNGLQVKHDYSTNAMPGVITPSTLTYTLTSSDVIHIVNYLGGDIDDTGSWDVNTSTRIISNQENFGPFDDDHSVFWIYTDVALNDQMLMCNIWKGVHSGTGDTLFNITGESMHGTMEVWVLEDIYGSEMWYEKERGFLVNGTMIHVGDYNMYEFVSAEIPKPGIPVDLISIIIITLISVIAIVSIIVIRRQKVKK